MNPQFNPVRTLIVDDSQDECQLLSAQLRSIYSIRLIGYVHDGVDAISYLRGVEEFNDREMFPYPDLLMLDFCMPRCGGMGVLKFLQGQFHRPRVILWSSTMERVSVSSAFRMGADLVCRKPESKDELMQIVRRIEARIFRYSPRVQSPEAATVICGRSNDHSISANTIH